MQAVNDYVILTQPEVAETTEMGIVIPESMRNEAKNTGRVISYGDNIGLGCPLALGMEILFQNGKFFEYEGEKYVVIKAEDILATF